MLHQTRKIALTALFISIGLILPFITANIPMIGNMLLPMHYPVFLCGFICGWQYGFLTGLLLPVLRSVLFGFPVFYPTAMAMAVELAAYGLISGLIFARRRTIGNLYFSLITAGLIGRILWGIAMFLLLGLNGSSFPISAFFAGAFINALPGIILQLILIPLLMIFLARTGVIEPLKTRSDNQR